jgi:hypothetical protein
MGVGGGRGRQNGKKPAGRARMSAASASSPSEGGPKAGKKMKIGGAETTIELGAQGGKSKKGSKAQRATLLREQAKEKKTGPKVSKNSFINKINVSNFESSTKIEALLAEIDAIPPDAKVLVFSQFIRFLELIEYKLKLELIPTQLAGVALKITAPDGYSWNPAALFASKKAGAAAELYDATAAMDWPGGAAPTTGPANCLLVAAATYPALKPAFNQTSSNEHYGFRAAIDVPDYGPTLEWYIKLFLGVHFPDNLA